MAQVDRKHWHRLTEIGKGNRRFEIIFLCAALLPVNTTLNASRIMTEHVPKESQKKLALIAVCNKLLKQAFAVVKSGNPYDSAYKNIVSDYIFSRIFQSLLGF